MLAMRESQRIDYSLPTHKHMHCILQGCFFALLGALEGYGVMERKKIFQKWCKWASG